MTAATTTTSTWRTSPSPNHPRSSQPSTTPRGHLPPPVGQAMSSQSSPPPTRSPRAKSQRSTSPGYFGLAVNEDAVPPDSNPGQHTRQNWIYSSSSRSSRPSPQLQTNDNNPALEAFRKQSETYGFNLNKTFPSLHRPSDVVSSPSSHTTDEFSPISPHNRTSSTSVAGRGHHAGASGKHAAGSFLGGQRHDSPMQASPVHRTVADHQHARLSLPTAELQIPPQMRRPQRSDTVPVTDDRSPMMAAASDVVKYLLLPSDKILALDLRVYPQYATSRVRGALNLCIPTTLLKRPSFTVQKMADTFTSDHHRAKFGGWSDCSYIIVYDVNSSQSKDAVMPVNVLKKFSALGWEGQGIIIRGGFTAFAKVCPEYIDKTSPTQGQGASTPTTSVTATSPNQIPVVGGCAMPATPTAANPFFGNIRQNMDLLDGVGQMPIKKPVDMSMKDEQALPAWLREASIGSDEGKQVSDKFLHIERGEQKRMQKALSGEVLYGQPAKEHTNQIQIAGIEKGSKNRYNNIFPYDHSRVKLQGVPSHGCDYVNANYVQAAYSNRRYIATQAPIPATFDDFWRVVWEQDVRVIVMLTAESEGGQVKSHAYWHTGDYGPLKLKKLSERQCSLDRPKKAGPVRPSLGTRRSTQPHTTLEKKEAQEQKAMPTEPSIVTIRHFTLSHSSHPFQPMREVTQIQYSQWPDFGAPASPTAMLGVIDQVNKYVRNSSRPTSAIAPDEAVPTGQRPIVVHCSAGCGRTGTFCTVDSVIDMLKRQKWERDEHDHDHGHDGMDVDILDDWTSRDDIDLVAKTVNDFRHQRLSMVQNLRQFVLCYESVMQWVVSQRHEEDPSSSARGRSFQGALG